jgi:hypothetical protein
MLQVRLLGAEWGAMRELDSRVNDGIHVRLLWIEADDRVMLAVEDAKTGDSFTVDVHRDDNALEAFHHPYAYAAWRGIPMSASGDRAPALPASAEPAF